jgi:NAD+ kinase
MRIAINGNRHQEGHFDEINKLVDTLLQRGDYVVMAQPFLDYLTLNLGDRFSLGIDMLPLTVPPDVDLAISIGGDGALLKTARWIGQRNIPVAGINTGHLGYLSAFTFENPDDIYNTLLQGVYRTEMRSMLQIDVLDTTLYALNELALTRADTPAMLTIDVTINGTSHIAYVGDGLIISTPTGSTAYNLSVGGPILDPELAGWVLSPIAAHSLSMRPMVIQDSSTIQIAINTRGTHFRLSTDGKALTLPLSAQLRVKRAPHPLHLILHPDHSFTDTLREKLGLGAN